MEPDLRSSVRRRIAMIAETSIRKIHWNTFVKNVDMRAIRGVSGELSAPTSTMNTHPLTSRNDVSTRYPSGETKYELSLIHISEPTRLGMISYAVFCLKKKTQP